MVNDGYIIEVINKLFIIVYIYTYIEYYPQLAHPGTLASSWQRTVVGSSAVVVHAATVAEFLRHPDAPLCADEAAPGSRPCCQRSHPEGCLVHLLPASGRSDRGAVGAVPNVSPCLCCDTCHNKKN